MPLAKDDCRNVNTSSFIYKFTTIDGTNGLIEIKVGRLYVVT